MGHRGHRAVSAPPPSGLVTALATLPPLLLASGCGPACSGCRAAVQGWWAGRRPSGAREPGGGRVCHWGCLCEGRHVCTVHAGGRHWGRVSSGHMCRATQSKSAALTPGGAGRARRQAHPGESAHAHGCAQGSCALWPCAWPRSVCSGLPVAVVGVSLCVGDRKALCWREIGGSGWESWGRGGCAPPVPSLSLHSDGCPWGRRDSACGRGACELTSASPGPGQAVWGESGELVCTKPIPCQPTHFWNDENGSKYRKAYFSKFPGRWASCPAGVGVGCGHPYPGWGWTSPPCPPRAAESCAGPVQQLARAAGFPAGGRSRSAARSGEGLAQLSLPVPCVPLSPADRGVQPGHLVQADAGRPLQGCLPWAGPSSI